MKFEMKKSKENLALIVLRSFLGLTMIIHGGARIYAGGVEPFGDFLSGQGFPLGFYIAWTITLFEIGGGIVFISGYFTAIIAIIFALQLILGIVFVHAPNGWFVVGLGRNGMEYSVLLIVSFICIAYAKRSEN